MLYGEVVPKAVAAHLGLTRGIVEACLSELAGAGFVQQLGGEYKPPTDTRPAFFYDQGSYTKIRWHLTELGRTAADEIALVYAILNAETQ